MSLRRFIVRGLRAVAAIGIIALVAALWVYRDIPAAELEARYAGPASRFITIDGARIHYRDEGGGPPVVLIHANFSNLIDWDPWVDALRDRYRVVRFDMTSHGLTGPDPTGDYSQERTLALTERLIDALGLGTITLGGTSMGGTVAIQYSAAHPERVLRLILLSPGSLEGQEQKRRGNVPKFAYALKYVMPRALPEFMHLLENAPLLTFISYPGVGHMAVEEAGAEIGKDVRTWLDQPLADNIQKSGPQQDPH